MSIKNIKAFAWQGFVCSTAAVLMLAAITAYTNAQDGRLFRGGFLKRAQSCQRCPECDEEVCNVSCVKVDELKSCFKVDYKTICVPKAKMPWDDCCEPRCAETKSVKVLLVHLYKCPKCKCKWEVLQPKPPIQYGEGEVYESTITDGHAYEEGSEYYYSPGEQGMPFPATDIPAPSQVQPLNEVPAAPPVPNSRNDTQHQYDDYFAPAKFIKKK